MENHGTIFVGVDYGTTASTFSYRLPDGTTSILPRRLPQWPGPPGGGEKAPSLIAYHRDNHDIPSRSWGFEVLPGMKSAAWTKLRLDTTQDPAKFFDATFEEAMSIGIMHLPDGMTAQQVVSDYLREMSRVIRYTLEKEVYPKKLDHYDLEFRFGIPAVWGESARTSFHDAIVDAGFQTSRGPGNSVPILMEIPEPELVMAKVLADNRPGCNPAVSFVRGDIVLVCDLGGGTVDMASYQMDPNDIGRDYTQLTSMTGGRCGAAVIDCNLHKLMKERFGAEYVRLPVSQRGPGSHFAAAFEDAKTNFGNSLKKMDKYYLPIGPGIDHDDNPNIFVKESRNVVLTHTDLSGLIVPVVDKICQEVEKEMEKAQKAADGRVVKKFIITGGFSLSPYVQKEIYNKFGRAGRVAIHFLPDPLMAIADGAVHLGTDAPHSAGRRCPRHYGISLIDQFDGALDSNTCGTTYPDPFTDITMIREIIFWPFRKNNPYPEVYEVTKRVRIPFTEASSTVEVLGIYECEADHAPRKESANTAELIGHLRCNFEGVDLRPFPKMTSNSGVVYNLEFEFRFRLNRSTDNNNVQFAAFINGDLIGFKEIKISS